MKIYEEKGSTAEEFSYDAWGRRRDPSTLQHLASGTTASSLISRGYTQHEHLDAFNLINMNGRLYDPQIGRMLSPDNYVNNPMCSQDYNRYSYVLNNPLKYIDPSGNYWVYGTRVISSYFYVPDFTKQEGYWMRRQTTIKYQYWVMDPDLSFLGGQIPGGLSDIQLPNVQTSTGGCGGGPVIGRTSLQNMIDKLLDQNRKIFNPGGANTQHKDFGGIKGLTLNFYSYSPDAKRTKYDRGGGVVIDLSYSTINANNCQWVQLYCRNNGKWTFDNRFTGLFGPEYSGSIYYYSPSELKDKIEGTTIFFHDNPSSPYMDDQFRFILSLYKGNERLFSLYYGYTIINGNTVPSFPIIIK